MVIEFLLIGHSMVIAFSLNGYWMVIVRPLNTTYYKNAMLIKTNRRAIPFSDGLPSCQFLFLKLEGNKNGKICFRSFVESNKHLKS